MTSLRDAVQEFVADYENGDLGDMKHYARALRAALAQPQPVQVDEGARMTTLREAAWQMLEALDSDHPDVQLRAAVALRAALAQQEQEQEPVAWLNRQHYLLAHAENMPPADKALAQGWTPLFTHPPRREWQGLSEEEIDHWTPEIHPVIRAIEAALKERNA